MNVRTATPCGEEVMSFSILIKQKIIVNGDASVFYRGLLNALSVYALCVSIASLYGWSAQLMEQSLHSLA